MNTQLLNAGKSSLNRVITPMRSLGLISDDTAKYMQITTSMMQMGVGAVGIWRLGQDLLEARAKFEERKAVALTAANSTNPIGWGKIAFATSVSAAVGFTLAAVAEKIDLGSFDLSTNIGRNAAVDAVRGVA